LSQTIVVLEDDPDIRGLVRYHLESNGFTVRLYDRIGSIVQEAEQSPPSLFLLDIMIPGGDGFELCRSLRSHPILSGVPVIFLTARAAEDDRVRGLEMGADDYIVKPFGVRELVARIKVVLRRFDNSAQESTPSDFTLDEIRIDRAAMQVHIAGELVPMTATEFRLLDYLTQRPNRVFSRDQLLQAVWSGARFVTDRSVDVYVGRLREKIETTPEFPKYLKTVRGAGYRFEKPKDRAST